MTDETRSTKPSVLAQWLQAKTAGARIGAVVKFTPELMDATERPETSPSQYLRALIESLDGWWAVSFDKKEPEMFILVKVGHAPRFGQ